MIIRCWGARGSIPVSGRQYVVYGGDTTCMEIRTKNDDIIIIDAGSGIRRLGNQLVKEGRKRLSLIFTHAHWDHLLGFPFFKPIYVPGVRITLFGWPFAQRSVRDLISKSMDPPYFPVQLDKIAAEICDYGICDEPFCMGPATVTPVRLSHPNQGLGFRIEEDGKSLVFLTDNELTHKHPGGLDYDAYVAAAEGADLLIHDAEFTADEYQQRTKGWGHSVFTDALRLALDAKAKRFGLFHHNQDRSDEAVEGMVRECEQIVESQGAALECFATASDMEVTL